MTAPSFAGRRAPPRPLASIFSRLMWRESIGPRPAHLEKWARDDVGSPASRNMWEERTIIVTLTKQGRIKTRAHLP